jgi:HEAT repeat protein
VSLTRPPPTCPTRPSGALPHRLEAATSSTELSAQSDNHFGKGDTGDIMVRTHRVAIQLPGFCRWGLVVPAILLGVDFARGDTRGSDPDQQLLEQAHVPTSGAELVQFLLDRSSPQAGDALRIDQLVRQLGDPNFRTRARASRELIALGQVALPALRRALADPDPERAERAKSCIRDIENRSEVPLALAAVRILEKRPVEGALEALLRFLSCAGEEELENETWYALDSVARRQDHLGPAVEAAVRSECALSRAAAGYLQGRRGNRADRAKAQRLLGDPDPLVRLRTAQGLLGARDKTGIPTLIALLEQSSLDLAWQAEELLHWIAGEDSPPATIGTGGEASRRCRTAWEDWWRRCGAGLELYSTARTLRRPALLMAFRANAGGEFCLVGCDGTLRLPRRRLYGLTAAQLLPGGQLLLAQRSEQPPHRQPGQPRAQRLVHGVTEQDVSGKVLWRSTRVPEPIAARRLPNGHTLIAGSRQLLEVDRANHIIWSADASAAPEPAQFLPCSACRLRNGHFLCRADRSDGHYYFEVDPASQQYTRRSFLEARGFVHAVLADGNCVVSEAGGHELLEVEEERVVWRCPLDHCPQGQHGMLRCRNGDTLLSCCPYRDNRICTMDRGGKCVWEIRIPGLGPGLANCFELLPLGFDWPRPASFHWDTLASRLAGLSDPNPSIRWMCAASLDAMGAGAASAIPRLIDSLDDPAAEVRAQVRRALWDLVRPSDLRCVLQATSDHRAHVRASVLFLLRRYPEAAHDIVPVLRQAIRDPNPLVRREAASVTSRFEREGPTLVPILIQALKDPDAATNDQDDCVCECAAESLAAFGLQARPALVPLLDCIETGKDRLRSRALWTLAVLAAHHTEFLPSVLPCLRKALTDRRYIKPRVEAAMGLGMLRQAAACAVPDLLQAFKVEDVPEPALAMLIRASVLGALRDIGPAARDAVPALLSVVRDSTQNPSLRILGAQALAHIGVREALPVLTAISANDACYEVRQSATQAIERIEEKAR